MSLFNVNPRQQIHKRHPHKNFMVIVSNYELIENAHTGVFC